MNLSDFDYFLPPERIAQEPLAFRDQAKFLLYDKGNISDHFFYELPIILPAQSFLVFNNTKVIPARLLFQKSSGAWIEILLLEPLVPSAIENAMQARKQCVWKCIVGNKKRFNQTLHTQFFVQDKVVNLSVTLLQENQVLFEWDSSNTVFSEILEQLGRIPLPPYIKREVNAEDKERYQSVFAKKEGAVAAPTASLHFTEKIFQELQRRNIQYDFLTLHVGAGTFQPIKVANFQEHKIHQEKMIISKKNIENLINNAHKIIIAVGTTAMRSLESLYWYGAEILQKKEPLQKIPPILHVSQKIPYQITDCPSLQEALHAVKEILETHGLDELQGTTEIYIYPNYRFKICKGLITNFHLPKTTLILLVAAFVGKDWRKIYEHALQNNYRFLSYGDSSLLLPDLEKFLY